MSIELNSRRGAVGKGWHAVALRQGAELLLGPARVSRGKADARAGRVQWLDVAPGVARGAVLDPDGEMHQARLDLPAFREGDRRAFVEVARTHPELPARLAGGEYPQRIEQELAGSEVSLLPRDASELTHDCSCLDWPGPCRHVGALVYVLVEAVDADPVLLLRLRGLALEDLVAPAGATAGPVPAGAVAPGTTPEAAPPDEHARAGEDPGPSAAGPSAAAPSTKEEGAPEQGPAEAPAAAFDPARTDPARLAEVLGEDAAAILHSFYSEGHA